MLLVILCHKYLYVGLPGITSPFYSIQFEFCALQMPDRLAKIHVRLDRQVDRNGRAPTVPQTSLQQAAATSVLLAASPLLEGVGGRYFEACNEAERVTRRPDDLHGVAPFALNPENADRLWDESVDMLAD